MIVAGIRWALVALVVGSREPAGNGRSPYNQELFRFLVVKQFYFELQFPTTISKGNPNNLAFSLLLTRNLALSSTS